MGAGQDQRAIACLAELACAGHRLGERRRHPRGGIDGTIVCRHRDGALCAEIEAVDETQRTAIERDRTAAGADLVVGTDGNGTALGSWFRRCNH